MRTVSSRVHHAEAAQKLLQVAHAKAMSDPLPGTDFLHVHMVSIEGGDGDADVIDAAGNDG